MNNRPWCAKNCTPRAVSVALWATNEVDGARPGVTAEIESRLGVNDADTLCAAGVQIVAEQHIGLATRGALLPRSFRRELAPQA